MLTTNPALGVYDYYGTFGSFNSRTDLTYDVTFFWWSAWYVKGSVYAACNAARSRGRIPVITVQPNHDPAIGTAANLLTDVAAGRYDAKIRLIASEMVAYNGPVIIRFAHEMDLPTNATQNGGRYDWAIPTQGVASPAYIAAWNRAINLFRSLVRQAKAMWSPAGQPWCNAYYPGAVVDYVGLSCYSFPSYDLKFYGRVRPYHELMQQKYGTVYVHYKPVILAEFAAAALTGYQATWVAAALTDTRIYWDSLPAPWPHIVGICYFNAKDTGGPWVPGGPIPDWSINPMLFK